MITVKTGDLLSARETIIAHQVNCMGAAGGLAAAIFERWPDAENDYYQVIDRCRDAGGVGFALAGTSQLTGRQKDGHIIANLFGQVYPGADYRPMLLKHALEMLATIAKAGGWSVALPYKLSCGICGGDWNEVQDIIHETMQGVDCVIYKKDGVQ